MPEETPVAAQPTDQQEYDRLWGGNPAPAETPLPKVEAKVEPSPEPEKKEPEPKPEEKPPTMFAGKYKTPEDLERGYKELESKLYETGTTAKEFLKYKESLANPSSRRQVYQDLVKQYGDDPKEIAKLLGVDTGEITGFSDLQDDDVLTVGQAKALLANEIKANAGNQQNTIALFTNAVAPLLVERREMELAEKYPLVKDADIKTLRDSLDAGDAEGTIGRDEILHLAAMGLALKEGKVEESMLALVEGNYKASLAKKKAQTAEPGIKTDHEIKPQVTPEQTAQAEYDASWDKSRGR